MFAFCMVLAHGQAGSRLFYILASRSMHLRMYSCSFSNYLLVSGVCWIIVGTVNFLIDKVIYGSYYMLDFKKKVYV